MYINQKNFCIFCFPFCGDLRKFTILFELRAPLALLMDHVRLDHNTSKKDQQAEDRVSRWEVGDSNQGDLLETTSSQV